MQTGLIIIPSSHVCLHNNRYTLPHINSVEPSKENFAMARLQDILSLGVSQPLIVSAAEQGLKTKNGGAQLQLKVAVQAVHFQCFYMSEIL